jgi:hypothetical protein
MHLNVYLTSTSRFWIFVLATCTLFCSTAWSQTKVSYDTAKPISNYTRLFVDPRLSLLSLYKEPTKTINPNSISGSIHSGKGFRVLIYSGTDRLKANATKSDFMRRYPGVRIYMTYAVPQYKIKVGDFTSRQSANNLYNELSNQYSPCMIVPDIVEINTLKKHD